MSASPTGALVPSKINGIGNVVQMGRDYVEFRHVTDVSAPVDVLWQLTLDVQAWPKITPATMRKVTLLDPAPLHVGSRAQLCQPRRRPRIWMVTRIEPLPTGNSGGPGQGARGKHLKQQPSPSSAEGEASSSASGSPQRGLTPGESRGLSQRVFSWETNIFGVRMEGLHAMSPTPSGSRSVLAIRLHGRAARLLAIFVGRRVRYWLEEENAAFAVAARQQVVRAQR